MNGIHLAAFTGSVLCACAALAVLKFMPHQIEQHGAMHDAVSAAEDMAELGLGGTMPVFADTSFSDSVLDDAALSDAVVREQVATEGIAGGG